MKLEINYAKLQDIEIDNAGASDWPDFSDAYISSARYPDRELTDEELYELNQDSRFVYDQAMKRLF